MAGIGFKLRRLTQEDTLTKVAGGYLSAAVLTSGPWLLTVMAVSFIHWMAYVVSGGLDRSIFQPIITYCYAASLIWTGPWQNLVTRYLSDRIYGLQDQFHFPAFVGILTLTTPFSIVLGLLLFLPTKLSPSLMLVAITLFVTICDIWFCIIFLGAARAYRSIVIGFGLGTAVTFALSWWANSLGELGFLSAYTAGQAFILVYLVSILVREFPDDGPIDLGFLHYTSKYPALPLCGLFLNLAIWVGPVTYWVSPLATQIEGLRSYPMHDLAGFFSFVSVVPASVLFFIGTETEFYEGYRDFFGGVTSGRASLSDLNYRKAQMIQALRDGAADILKVQGLVSLCAWFAVPHLQTALGFPLPWIDSIRLCLLGAFGLVLVQFLVMILYYYEAYSDALKVAVLLFCLNLGGTIASLYLPSSTHGMGLLIGSSLALILGLIYVYRNVHQLEYLTYMFQPMPGTIQGVPPQEAFAKSIRKDGNWLVSFDE